MAQNYYSKRTVEKLKAAAYCAEQNFASTLADNEKLGAEITELKEELARYKKYYSDANSKVVDLETQLGLRKSYNEGMAMHRSVMKRTALRRAHEELHKVKPTEENKVLLHRAIGNAQGILAAAIDANTTEGEAVAAEISLYPDEEKRAREEMMNPRRCSCGRW